MTKGKTQIYDIIKTVIFSLFVIFVQLREVSVLDRYTGSSIVTAGILLTGLVVIFIDVFVTRTCFKNRLTDLLFVFLCLTGISCLFNHSYGLTDNAKALCEMVLFFFMLFPSVTGWDKDRKRNLFRVILSVVCILWFVLASISIGMYLFRVEYYIGGGSWGASNQGFSTLYQRLWGIFQDQNYAGYVSVAVITAGLYFIKTAKKKAAATVLNVISMLIQFTFITLSGSRSVMIVLACATMLYIFYVSAVYFKEKKHRVVLQGVTAAIFAVAFIGIVEAGTFIMPYVRKGTDTVVPDSVQDSIVSLYDTAYENSDLELLTEDEFYERIKETLKDEDEDDEEDEDDTERLQRADLQELNGDISNGRFTRWMQSLEIFLNTPIFGTSPRNVSAFAKVHNPDTLMAKYGIASHNGYIDVLVCTGVLGFAAFIVFFVFALKGIIKKYFRFEDEDDFAASTAIAFIYAIATIFVSDLFFIITIGAFMFWFNLGFASSYTDDAGKTGYLEKLFGKINSVIDKILHREGKKA